jgi:hypothetical protein
MEWQSDRKQRDSLRAFVVQMVAMTQAMQKKQQQQQMQSYMQQQPQWGAGAGVMARPQPPQPAPPPNPYAVQGQFGGYEDPYGVYAGGGADAWPVVDAHAQYAQQQQQQYAGWGGMEQQTWGGMEQQAAHGAYGQQQQAYQYTQPPQPQGMATNGMAAMAMAAMTGMGMGMGSGGGMGTAVQKNGPEGCNLFIYHIPAAWTDQDIAASFSPFGNIVSATVMKDKNTGAHKGFGFVSTHTPLMHVLTHLCSTACSLASLILSLLVCNTVGVGPQYLLLVSLVLLVLLVTIFPV